VLLRFILLFVFTAMAAVCDRLICIVVVVGSLLAIDILLFNTGVVFVSARPMNLLRSNIFTVFGYFSLALAFSPFWLWLHCSGESAIARILDAIYQSVRTLTTAGPEGPLSGEAKALASFESLIGIYFLSIIIAGYLSLPKGGRTA
jgi:hypothetical protein